MTPPENRCAAIDLAGLRVFVLGKVLGTILGTFSDPQTKKGAAGFHYASQAEFYEISYCKALKINDQSVAIRLK